MKKLFISLLIFLAGSVHAEDPSKLNPAKLMTAMSQLQSKFESMKPAQAEQALDFFPTAMGYLSEIQDVKGVDNRARINAAVNLAIATVPFTEEIPAADVLCIDYSLPENKAIYEEEIAKNPNHEYGNTFVKALKAYAESLKDNEQEAKKVQKTSSKKSKKK